MTREEAKEYIFECLDHDEATEIIKALCPESCEDTVSREEAIRVLQENCSHWDTNVMLIDIATDLLKKLPSVTPTPKWIPISERLPEKNGKYLAYIINKKDTNLQYVMTCEYYEGDLWNWFPDDDCASDNVVAWMPLPEPYKAEMEGDEE